MDKARYFFIILGLLLMFYIIRSVRKGKLSIDHSLLWSAGAIVIFIIGCFPRSFDWISQLVGVNYPPSLLFLLSVAFLLLLSLHNSIVISELKEKNKELIQQIAVLEERTRQLENEDVKKENTEEK